MPPPLPPHWSASLLACCLHVLAAMFIALWLRDKNAVGNSSPPAASGYAHAGSRLNRLFVATEEVAWAKFKFNSNFNRSQQKTYLFSLSFPGLWHTIILAVKSLQCSCIIHWKFYVMYVMYRWIVVVVTNPAALVVSGSPRTGKCRSACDTSLVTVRTTGPVQACVSDTALPHVKHRDVGRQQAYQREPVTSRWRADATCPGYLPRASSAYSPNTCELWLNVFRCCRSRSTEYARSCYSYTFAHRSNTSWLNYCLSPNEWGCGFATSLNFNLQFGEHSVVHFGNKQ